MATVIPLDLPMDGITQEQFNAGFYKVWEYWSHLGIVIFKELPNVTFQALDEAEEYYKKTRWVAEPIQPPYLVETYERGEIWYRDQYKDYYLKGARIIFSTLEATRAWIDDNPPHVAQTYMGFEIWHTPSAGDYHVVGLEALEGKYYTNIITAISNIKVVLPFIEPIFVEVYRGYEIWTRPQFNDFITPPPIDAASSTIEGIRMAIDRYIPAPILIAGREAKIPENMLNLIPPETTDIIRVDVKVPKIVEQPSNENIKRKVQDQLIDEGYTDIEVLAIFKETVPTSFFEWSEVIHYWLCVRSPIAVTTALTIAGFLAFFGLLSAVIIRIVWVPIEEAKIAADVVKDANETIEDIKDTNQKLINDILQNPNLTDEQKEKYVNTILQSEAQEIDAITKAQEKAMQTGGSWVDTILELAPIGVIGIGLLLLLSFMPRRRD